MVHQPSAGFQGQATDIEIHANEVLSLKKSRYRCIYNTKHCHDIKDLVVVIVVVVVVVFCHM